MTAEIVSIHSILRINDLPNLEYIYDRPTMNRTATFGIFPTGLQYPAIVEILRGRDLCVIQFIE